MVIQQTRASVIIGFICVIILHSAPSLAQVNIGDGAIAGTYKSHCASCHGDKLQGGLGSALNDDIWKYAQTDEDRVRVIKEGIPDTEMASWKKKLSDAEIRALIILMREQNQIAKTTAVINKSSGKKGIFTTTDHKFKLEKIGSGEDTLWSLDFLPDGSILSTQIDGKLWHFNAGKRSLITGTPKVWRKGQGGLLEVQLHPNYKNNHWIYLTYARSDYKGKGLTAIVRGKIKKNQWVEQQDIFNAPESFHTSSGSHFGSRLVFSDGYLFFGIGDRGARDQAQDITRPNGKIHRIFDDGRIPKDNPFYKSKGAFKSIWSYGNRNPQGLDKHPVTGMLWETEHGPRGGDETNLVEKGKNYGWPIITYGMNYSGKPMTALTHKEGMEQPKHYWVPSIAVCGIDFYEGKAFGKWQNDLLVGGLKSEELHRLVIKNNTVIEDEIIMKNQGRVRDVASGPDGFIYVLLSSTSSKVGTLSRLIPVK